MDEGLDDVLNIRCWRDQGGFGCEYNLPPAPPWLITAFEAVAVAGILLGVGLLLTGRTPRWFPPGRNSAPRVVRLSGLADVLFGTALLGSLLGMDRIVLPGVPLFSLLLMAAMLAQLPAIREATKSPRRKPPNE